MEGSEEPWATETITPLVCHRPPGLEMQQAQKPKSSVNPLAPTVNPHPYIYLLESTFRMKSINKSNGKFFLQVPLKNQFK
jgi:hypothetical protein